MFIDCTFTDSRDLSTMQKKKTGVKHARAGVEAGGGGREERSVVLRWRPVLSRFPSRVQYKKIEKGCEKSDIMYSV